MSAGLSRRRIGGGDDGTVAEDSDARVNGVVPSIVRTASPSVSSPVNGAASYGGTALEGSNEVAYDPRDLVEQEQDRGRMPLLTLLDEVLLLGLKDKQVRTLQPLLSFF
jgi:Golgi phosphoprotein 3